MITTTFFAACTTVSDPSTTSDTERPAVDLLHDRNALRRAITAIEEKVGATPAHVSEIDVYPEYVIVDAQDPEIPEHIDRYEWRDNSVEPPEPVHLSGPQEDVDASLFPTSAVDMARIPSFVRAAEQRLEHAEPIRVEDASVSYLSIERSTSLDGRVTIRMSVEGPRRSGSVETATSGEILDASVS